MSAHSLERTGVHAVAKQFVSHNVCHIGPSPTTCGPLPHHMWAPPPTCRGRHLSPALSSQLGLATGADIPPPPSATACRIPSHAFNSSPSFNHCMACDGDPSALLSLPGMRWRPISPPITAWHAMETHQPSYHCLACDGDPPALLSLPGMRWRPISPPITAWHAMETHQPSYHCPGNGCSLRAWHASPPAHR